MKANGEFIVTPKLKEVKSSANDINILNNEQFNLLE